MAKDFDEENWSPEAQERFERSKDRRQGIAGAYASLPAHNQRRRARSVARAVFDTRQEGEYSVRAAAERLQVQEPKAQWNYKKVLYVYKSTTCQKELCRLEARADTNSLHEREELISKITDSLHFDKRSVYHTIPGWTDPETGQVHPPQYVMKPMEEWSDVAAFAFDGMDYKLPKGRDPIPVPKFLAKDALLEKACRELGMWKEKVVGDADNPVIHKHEHSVVIPEYDPNDPESVRRAHESVFGLPAALRDKQGGKKT